MSAVLVLLFLVLALLPVTLEFLDFPTEVPFAKWKCPWSHSSSHQRTGKDSSIEGAVQLFWLHLPFCLTNIPRCRWKVFLVQTSRRPSTVTVSTIIWSTLLLRQRPGSRICSVSTPPWSVRLSTRIPTLLQEVFVTATRVPTDLV